MFGHIEMLEKILPTFFAQKELIKRLNDIEWEDFECKEAQINRFGHIEGSVIFLPILLAQNDGLFFCEKFYMPKRVV